MLNTVDSCPTRAAHYAALLIYTWDMCSIDLSCCAPTLDPRIESAGWSVVGYLLGSDNIIQTERSTGKKQLVANAPTEHKVCYGYLAKNSEGEYIATFRGTDGVEEWFDDFEFFPKKPRPPLEGKVDSGFYEIFDSMIYQSVNNAPPCRLAPGIAAAIGNAPLTLIGHSLGTTLGIYASAELAALCDRNKLSIYLFACPKPGDKAFSDYFEQLGLRYQVFNYQKDWVPDLPPLGYSALQNIQILPVGGIDGDVHIGMDKTCCHHLISYTALLSTQVFQQILNLPGTTPDDHQCAQCVTLTQPIENETATCNT